MKRLAGSPGWQGLLASLLFFAGLVLMARAAQAAWETFAPAAPPADARIIDDTGAGDDPALPADVTVIADPTEPAPALPTPTPGPANAGALAAASASATAAPDPTAQADDVALSAFVWEVDGAAAAAEIEIVDAEPARAEGAGLPTRLVIPSISVDSPVVGVSLVTQVQRGKTVSTWQVARNAVGFHDSSALPGTLGNTVLSGHNNEWGRVFRNLVNVKRGDEIQVFVGDRVLRYAVEDKVLVRQSNASIAQRQRNGDWIAPTDDERLTLVSCWPYRSATHRVIVVARPR
jgi:sortase A